MEPITVNATHDGFECGGRPTFYLADTCWSAFTNATLDEWEGYLRYRQAQGFNAVQVNTLVQHDRSRPDLDIYPYDTTNRGDTLDYSAPNPAYWERAREMCRMAATHGIRPVLVLLWGNLAPANWMDAFMAERQVMPFDEIARHVGRVVEYLGEFEPMYLVSGDVDFETPESIAYYEEALTCITRLSPSSLKGFHIARAYDNLPEQFLDRIDFYAFQSGHNRDAQAKAWELPLSFLARYPRKPLVNSEPCYEQMGYSHRRYGRFGAADVRAAAWSSVLSGACAGVTYGAHGIWNWRDLHYAGTTSVGEVFDTPLPWQDALRLPAAWDLALIPWLLDRGDGIHVTSAQDLLDDDTDRIHVSRQATPTGERILAYLPTPRELVLHDPAPDGAGEGHTSYSAHAIDLVTRRVAWLSVTAEKGDAPNGAATLRVGQPPFENDALVVLEPLAG